MRAEAHEAREEVVGVKLRVVDRAQLVERLPDKVLRGAVGDAGAIGREDEAIKPRRGAPLRLVALEVGARRRERLLCRQSCDFLLALTFHFLFCF